MTIQGALEQENFDVTEVSDGTKGELPDQVRSEIEEIQSEVGQIREEPSEWVKQRVLEIAETVETLPDREPTEDGNITMKQHMEQRKSELNSNGEQIAEERAERLNDEARRILEREVDD